MNDELSMLEEKILDLEFKTLRKSLGWSRTQITSTRSTPAGKVPMEMRVSRKDGSERCEIRTATGWAPLPTNRALWPTWAREGHEAFEKYEKAHSLNGRRISAACGTAGLG
jgi:hypothetical protein